MTSSSCSTTIAPNDASPRTSSARLDRRRAAAGRSACIATTRRQRQRQDTHADHVVDPSPAAIPVERAPAANAANIAIRNTRPTAADDAAGAQERRRPATSGGDRRGGVQRAANVASGPSCVLPSGPAGEQRHADQQRGQVQQGRDDVAVTSSQAAVATPTSEVASGNGGARRPSSRSVRPRTTSAALVTTTKAANSPPWAAPSSVSPGSVGRPSRTRSARAGVVRARIASTAHHSAPPTG